MRGRPPKSLEVLKMTGQFRADRHGEREASEVRLPSALPTKPEGLSEAASEHWDRIIEHIGKTGAVAEIDGEAIEMACRYWANWQKLMAICESDPLDRFARANLMAYGDAWARLAAKLGLTPVDRMRLRVSKSEEKKGVASRQRA